MSRCGVTAGVSVQFGILYEMKNVKKMFLIVNERENVELDTIFMLIIFKFLFLLNVLIC